MRCGRPWSFIYWHWLHGWLRCGFVRWCRGSRRNGRANRGQRAFQLLDHAGKHLVHRLTRVLNQFGHFPNHMCGIDSLLRTSLCGGCWLGWGCDGFWRRRGRRRSRCSYRSRSLLHWSLLRRSGRRLCRWNHGCVHEEWRLRRFCHCRWIRNCRWRGSRSHRLCRWLEHKRRVSWLGRGYIGNGLHGRAHGFWARCGFL